MGLYLNIASFILCIIIVMLGNLIFKDKEIRQKIFIGMIFLLLFFSYTKVLEKKYNQAFTHINVNESLVIKIVSNKEKGDYYNRYIGIVKNGKYKNYKILIYVKDEEGFVYGDIIEFSGEISKPNEARNKNGFDYSKYLREKKIPGIIQVENYKKISLEKDFFHYLYKLKDILLNRVNKMYIEEEAGFINAILFGKTSELDEEIRENFKLSNLSHVLAISGMHISYIVMGLEKSLKVTIKNIKLRCFFIIIFLIVFIPFVGGSASVTRACIMTIITYMAKIFLEKEDFYSSFCIALFIILLINPYNINSISMWLSFGGSIGIVTFNKFLYSLIVKKLNKKNVLKKTYEEIFIENKMNIKKYIEKAILKIIEIAIISISAQIIIIPIMLYYFNTVSIFFWISNILISFIIGPILIIGYVSVIFYPVGEFLAIIEKILLKIMFIIAEICARIPFNQIFLPTPRLYVIIIYYCLIFYFILNFNKRKMYYLRIFLSNKYFFEVIQAKKQFIKKVLICVLVLIVILCFIILIPKGLKINFLDVGQGDCTLIRTTTNKVILIDSGEGHSDKYDYGKNVVFPYLLDEGIMKIDYLIISHFDSDHARWNVLYIREYEG